MKKQLSRTHGICTQCNAKVPATICESDGRIVMLKDCPEHGASEALISSSASWYHRTMGFKPRLLRPNGTAGAADGECPSRCGHCHSHQQRMYLPVVPITSACNLNCPVCYTINNNSDPYHMSEREFAAVLESIRAADPQMQIINFTGGEPLVHPKFVRFVEMCSEAGIQRITLSTNGLELLEDPELLPRLTELDARIVLSFNSFRPQPHAMMSGGAGMLEKKMQMLELLAKYKPSTTLLAVAASGINDDELGEIAQYVLDNDHIVSMEVHTITYTGMNAKGFAPSARLTTPDVIDRISAKLTMLGHGAFVPSPCAHPLCYSVSYMMRLPDGSFAPLSDFLLAGEIAEMLGGSLYMEPNLRTERILQDAMTHIWSKPDQGDYDRKLLAGLDDLVRVTAGYGLSGRVELRKAAEKRIKAIYIHSHMDAENFDSERSAQCCGAVPHDEGRWIPTCAYNNFHRAADSRFNARAAASRCVL